jgi:peptidyl-prolyl cis-trans isomerase D
MAKSGNSLSKTFVWILLGLLIVGLAGFGATGLSDNIRSVGSVGEKDIPVNLYARTLQEELRALSAQTGQQIPFTTAQQFGIDRRVLEQVITARALDHETAQLGLSIGDEELQKQILTMSAFQGLNGSFDRSTYGFALENAGLSEAEFEESLREEAARTMVQGAIVSGNQMPDVYTDTLVAFVAERRNATVARLTAGDLETPIAAPTTEQLTAYYDENIENYTLPETKRISYVWLSPDMILNTVEVDDTALREAYEARTAEFNTPERRLIERLVYATEADASSAKAQLEAGGSSFEVLVEDRGLTLGDIDMGDVTQDALGAAGEAVFAASTGDVVGPLPSDLGPALFRINGILAAQATSFEEAEPQLRDALAADRARRVVETQINDIDDLLAGGATLEDVATETEMELGSVDWTLQSDEGLAGYEAFRDVARIVTLDDFPEVAVLEDGGIFALRLDEVLEPRPEPMEDILERVTAGWETRATREALRAQAEALIVQITPETDLTELGLDAEIATELTRTAFSPLLPQSGLTELFGAGVGEVIVIETETDVILARLDRIMEADQSNEDVIALRARLADQAAGGLSQDLFAAFATDIQQRAGIQIDQNAINAVHANFQ